MPFSANQCHTGTVGQEHTPRCFCSQAFNLLRCITLYLKSTAKSSAKSASLYSRTSSTEVLCSCNLFRKSCVILSSSCPYKGEEVIQDAPLPAPCHNTRHQPFTHPAAELRYPQ